jgi:penicillin-binding protein 1A
VSFSTAGAFALVQSWLTDVPSLDAAEAFSNPLKTRVYAGDGTTQLAEFYELDREPVGAEQVSPNVFNATVAIEDERFWGHRGVDYYGIARAAVNDLMGGDLQGASTITQQFIRQTVLQEEANESTIKRKVREAYLALELEKMVSKEEVLLMYLNTINYGDGAWGIQSAAQHYFSKNASELTVPEAALLSGIPQNPTYNNPVEYPEDALRRRNMVLDRMYVNGYISEQELAEYKATELDLNLRTRSMDGIYQQPYFTSYVREELWAMERDGILDPGQVLNGGLTVYTTIDLQMQAYAEEACAQKEESLVAQTGDPDVEVGLTCVESGTGYIKAMRGGKDYYADQWNTAWQMQRQVGSTAKVFALVTAIEEGYSPQTTVSGASPITLTAAENGGVEGKKVQNYGGQNMGTMSLAQATWKSSNTAYIRVARKVTPLAVRDTAIRMGIESYDPTNATGDLKVGLEHPGLSIVLGAYGANTLEMASAFGTLAAGGVRHEPTAITKIVDHEGNVIYDHESDAAGEQVLTPEVAYATNEVLKGVVTGGTGVAANLGWQVAAGKTGTADDYKDSWFVGYTPQLSTAVWIGKRGVPVPIDDNAGGDNCCPVWKKFMNNALDGYEAQDFPVADNPTYDPKASFLSAEEKKKAEEEAKKKAEEEEAAKKKAEKEEAAAKKKAEEEAKKKAEEEAKKNPPAGGGTGGDPGGGGSGGGDPGGGGGSGGGGSSGGDHGGGGSGGGDSGGG